MLAKILDSDPDSDPDSAANRRRFGVPRSLLFLESEGMDSPPVDQVLLFESGLWQIRKRLFAIDNCVARSGAKDFSYDDGIVVVV